MSGWDQTSVYSTGVLPGEQIEGSLEQVELKFTEFVAEFMIDNVYIYREQLRRNLLVFEYAFRVDLKHLIAFDDEITQRLTKEPLEILPRFEAGVRRFAQKLLGSIGQERKDIPDFQVVLKSDANILSLRDLSSEYVTKLIRVPGIVIGAQALQSRATHLVLVCRHCQHKKVVQVPAGWTGVSLPRFCQGENIPGQTKDCPQDPYVVSHERSKFVDQQNLKLQEMPDMVPVGELPRHIPLCCDRYLTNYVSPGTRCIITGIYSTIGGKDVKASGAVALGKPYIQVVGIELSGDAGIKLEQTFSEQQEDEYLRLSRLPNLFQEFAESIAPSIYGNEDIKKAIACLLVGGSKKILPDGLRLRGDINVLLLGDPGTAKSQLLKFVEKVAPVAVYTSGKGSSAAGLTASVQRDRASGDFYLEGGAMVLADGGVVCIDEFDKMRDEDRVAIHEAMEQQTISIAKAGITTILNSRTSVLAAANPVFGRYDDLKSPGENVDFQTTILSRFDMIFIVKDIHNEERDMTVAKHVINIHSNSESQKQDFALISAEKMRKYVTYCRQKVAPRLSVEAAEKLSSHFVSIRKKVHIAEQQSNERSTIPITVRQLEAIIRMTESIAKIHLRTEATEADADEAIRLFLASTMDAFGRGQTIRQELYDEITKIESGVRKRLPMGWSTNYSALAKEFITNRGFSQETLHKALTIMEKKDVIALRSQGRIIYRSGV